MNCNIAICYVTLNSFCFRSWTSLYTRLCWRFVVVESLLLLLFAIARCDHVHHTSMRRARTRVSDRLKKTHRSFKYHIHALYQLPWMMDQLRVGGGYLLISNGVYCYKSWHGTLYTGIQVPWSCMIFTDWLIDWLTASRHISTSRLISAKKCCHQWHTYLSIINKVWLRHDG